jgi:hypothetical protein
LSSPAPTVRFADSVPDKLDPARPHPGNPTGGFKPAEKRKGERAAAAHTR